MTTVLQFSGGKDSLAMLHLLKPRWNELVVMWCNTGAAFPETIELMRDVQTTVPYFLEVKGTQNIASDGYPADVIPTLRTKVGLLAFGSSAQAFQSRFTCCAHAIWAPMHRACVALGATTIIRGQKNSDALRAPVVDGQVVDGVRYEFPLHDWADADVYKYLSEHDIPLPRNYKLMNTGLDCWNCTAYLGENQKKLAYMREHHPDKHVHVARVLRDLNRAVSDEAAPMKTILESTCGI